MNEDKGKHFDISITSEALFRILFVGLGLVFLYLIRDVLIVLLLSVVIAAAISPLASRMQKHGIPRTLAVFIIYFVAVAVLASILYFILSPLSGELDDLSLVFPVYFDKIQSSFNEIRSAAPQYEQIINTVQSQLAIMSQKLASLSTNIFGATSHLFGGVVSAIFVVVISFYLSAQEYGISMFLRSITPKENQSYILGLWARSQHKLGRWFQIQILSSVIIGGLVFIGLAIFGIKHKILLALFAGLMEVIPYVGPILAAIPAIFLGLLKSPIVALWTLVVYTIVHQLENHVVVPQITRRVMGLNPVIVILALMIGGELMGIPGIILGVPIAVIAVEIVKDFGHDHDDSN